MNGCIFCGKDKQRASYKYCSNKCQWRYQYEKFIEAWQEGGIIDPTKNISKYLKRFLIEKFGEKCSLCGWDKKNPTTKRVPLEVDHIDGHTTNNSEKNLQIICPNCHSLTPTFRNLNKGRGRSWRK